MATIPTPAPPRFDLNSRTLAFSLGRFQKALSDVAIKNAGPNPWLEEAAEDLASHFDTSISDREIRRLVRSFGEREKLPVEILMQEMNFFADRYGGNLTWRFTQQADAYGIEFADTQPEGFPDIGTAVEAGETVQGSIEKLLKRLPPWLRKSLDVTLELAKLARLSV